MWPDLAAGRALDQHWAGEGVVRGWPASVLVYCDLATVTAPRARVTGNTNTIMDRRSSTQHRRRCSGPAVVTTTSHLLWIHKLRSAFQHYLDKVKSGYDSMSNRNFQKEDTKNFVKCSPAGIWGRYWLTLVVCVLVTCPRAPMHIMTISTGSAVHRYPAPHPPAHTQYLHISC